MRKITSSWVSWINVTKLSFLKFCKILLYPGSHNALDLFLMKKYFFFLLLCNFRNWILKECVLHFVAFVHLSWFNYAGEIIRIGLFFSEIFRFILIFCMYSGAEIGLYVILFAIWYQLYNVKCVENTHGEVSLLQSCNFKNINTPPWVFFTFVKFYKLNQIAQRITYALYVILKNWYHSLITVFVLRFILCTFQALFFLLFSHRHPECNITKFVAS